MALRRSHQIAAQIERDFEAARSAIGLKVEQTILRGADRDQQTLTAKTSDAPSAATVEEGGPRLGQFYDASWARLNARNASSDPDHRALLLCNMALISPVRSG